MSTEASIETEILLARKSGYQFEIEFPDLAHTHLISDEPAPLGKGEGPNPSALLGAAVANCMAASLVFCMSKRRAEVESLQARVKVELYRNEANRLRIKEVNVKLQPKVPEQSREAFEKCKEVFEDFCVVTASLRQGVPVNLQIEV